jgi:hypothetical protein
MPEWATPNRIDLELDTLRLRDFSRYGSAPISTPVLIDPPYAGHSSSLADYAKGQSLVETLRTAGHDRVFVMDWKGATSEMKDYGRCRGSTSGRHPAFRHCHGMTPGGHIGLFMGSKTLAEAWPRHWPLDEEP